MRHGCKAGDDGGHVKSVAKTSAAGLRTNPINSRLRGGAI
jgi:hypothetical protein